MLLTMAAMLFLAGSMPAKVVAQASPGTTPVPQATAAAPTAAPSLAPSSAGASPVAAAPAYGYAFTPPPVTGSPRITLVQLNSDRLRAGGPIDIKVTTTTDVVKVTTGNGNRQGTLTQAAPGVFVSEATLPHVGGPLVIHIKLHFAAYTADGKSVSVDVPVSYH
jgi:hypothetical protein